MLDLLQSDPLVFVLVGVAIVFALGLHEYAHALAADLQGDRLPRAMGRLTLNPVKHLDPLGTLLILLVGFGWAKPVEFRPNALASKRFGAALVALAGPLMNIVLALAAAFILIAMAKDGSIEGVIEEFLLRFAEINIVLAVFNLLPIPPLDGSRLLTIFLPPSKQRIIFFLDRYGILILLALLFFGRESVLEPLITSVGRFIFRLAGAG